MKDLPECKTLILLDVEYTAWEGSQTRQWSEPWEEMEIIQIAMLAVDHDSLKPLNHFSCLIKPTINPTLSDYIMKLTGITQHAMDTQGLSLGHAMAKSVEFIDSVDQPAGVISNGNDGELINRNSKLVDLKCPDRFVNSQDIKDYIRDNIANYRSGHCTGDLADLVGNHLEGHKHNALFDVHSLAAGLRYIRQQRDSCVSPHKIAG